MSLNTEQNTRILSCHYDLSVQMHGDRTREIAHTVKHERLQVRREAKAAKRERKERQKEIKKDLTRILEGKTQSLNEL